MVNVERIPAVNRLKPSATLLVAHILDGATTRLNGLLKIWFMQYAATFWHVSIMHDRYTSTASDCFAGLARDTIQHNTHRIIVEPTACDWDRWRFFGPNHTTRTCGCRMYILLLLLPLTSPFLHFSSNSSFLPPPPSALMAEPRQFQILSLASHLLCRKY